MYLKIRKVSFLIYVKNIYSQCKIHLETLPSTSATISSPKYSGNQVKAFEWFKSLKTHLSECKWEKIPNKAVKKMLLSCIMWSARQEIVLLQPQGVTFESYDTGAFFMELLKKFSQEKDEEGPKQEYQSRKYSKL